MRYHQTSTLYPGLHGQARPPVLQEGLLPIPNALLNDSLLLGGITKATLGPTTGAQSLFVHPYVIGGWCGLVATALNCLPVGCLDGGRIMQVPNLCGSTRAPAVYVDGRLWSLATLALCSAPT